MAADTFAQLGFVPDQAAAESDFTPAFDTKLDPAQEAAFQNWKAVYAPHDSGQDYDLRGAFKAGLKPDAKTGHWADTFKKPNHPTFSDQSRYAKFGKPGHWNGDTFVPSGGSDPFAALGFAPDLVSQIPVPSASQADVRKQEIAPTPMGDFEEKAARFENAIKQFVAQTGGALKPGQTLRQAAAEWSGIPDPEPERQKAEIVNVAEGGDLQYGGSVPYTAAKTLASMGGFAAGGPAGATAAEMPVRAISLAYNLKKAMDAGAIDADRAAGILAREMAKGTASDAAYNVALPIIGQIVRKIPGMSAFGQKVLDLLGSKGNINADLAKQQSMKLANRIEEAQTPAEKQAVEDLSSRIGPFTVTPGQVTGKASLAEQTARLSGPQKFDAQQEALQHAAEGMRSDLLAPAEQPTRQGIGQMVQDTAAATETALKNRLRPTFEAADNLGVKVDFNPVLARAKAALAEDASVPNGRLLPQERADLEKLVQELSGSPDLGISSKSQVSAAAALDFMSRQKEKVRAITADYKPSKYYETIMDDLTKTADQSYTQAAVQAGKGDVARNLVNARNDYREMMSTVYDDAVKAALKKNPEDVGRLFWQNGNVSEPQQLQKLLAIAQREGAASGQDAANLSRAMTRGFLQEAVPNVKAAANWSKTLAEKPGLRDTWNTLTAAPGGPELRHGMEVLEQAAKMATRGNQEFIGQLGMAAIPFRRAAGLGVGVSYVTGVIHPGMAIAGLSVDALTRMMATAYTQGNKGILNATMRALRANGAASVAGAQVLKQTLPQLEQYAADHGITDLFVPAPAQPTEQPLVPLPGAGGVRG